MFVHIVNFSNWNSKDKIHFEHLCHMISYYSLYRSALAECGFQFGMLIGFVEAVKF